MTVKEAVLTALKELVLPELQALKQEQSEIKTALALTNERLDSLNQRLDDTNKRLDDLNAHLIDQSRRIDQIRSELTQRIETVRRELLERIEAVRSELTESIEAVRSQLTERLDAVRTELTLRQDETNHSIGRLYEVIVRKDEHQSLESRVSRLEEEVAAIKKHLAA